MVSLLFKTALPVLLAPLAAAAEAPAVAVAWERGTAEVARLRAENAARSIRGLSFAGAWGARETSAASLALGARARHADLVLVVQTSGIRVLDVDRRAFVGPQLEAAASAAEVRRLVAQIARRWHAARPRRASGRTWLAYLVAGAAAAAFVAFVAIRVADDDEPEPGLTLRFVSP